MTPALEELAHALNTNRIPQEWRAPGAHASLRAWVDGTVARSAYVDTWKTSAGLLPGSVLWMGALFHPSAYLAATAQVYARKHKVSVDNVFMHAQVLQVCHKSSSSTPFSLHLDFIFGLLLILYIRLMQKNQLQNLLTRGAMSEDFTWKELPGMVCSCTLFSPYPTSHCLSSPLITKHKLFHLILANKVYS